MHPRVLHEHFILCLDATDDEPVRYHVLDSFAVPIGVFTDLYDPEDRRKLLRSGIEQATAAARANLLAQRATQAAAQAEEAAALVGTPELAFAVEAAEDVAVVETPPPPEE